MFKSALILNELELFGKTPESLLSLTFYPKQGYQLVEVPRAAVEERVAFILATLKAMENNAV